VQEAFLTDTPPHILDRKSCATILGDSAWSELSSAGVQKAMSDGAVVIEAAKRKEVAFDRELFSSIRVCGSVLDGHTMEGESLIILNETIDF
jgi:hypothetical protein